MRLHLFVILLALAALPACDAADPAADADAGVHCPPCADGEICVVRCDGSLDRNATASCEPDPLDCGPALSCSAECEASLCTGGDPASPYHCQFGTACPEADAPAFYCQGN